MLPTVSSADPPKLTYVITELYVGGAEKCLTELACRLQSAWDLEVVSLMSLPSDGPLTSHSSAFVSRLRHAEVPVRSLGLDRAWQLPAAWRQLRRLLAARPGVTHSFLFHANLLTDLTMRPQLTQHVMGIRVADPSPLRARLEQRCLRRAKGIVCVSESVRRAYVHRWGLEFPWHVIGNGVEKPAASGALKRSDWGIPDQAPLAVTVARLHTQKGLDWLLSAWAQAPADAHWAILGEGPQQQQLSRQAQELGLGDRVHLVGWRSDVADWFTEADLFLLPSRWEGMPNALLEAMSCNLPFVARDVEGVSEVAGPHKQHQVIDTQEPADFMSAVTWHLVHREASRRLGQLNGQHVLTHFSWDRVAEQYHQLYQSLLHSRSGPTSPPVKSIANSCQVDA